MIRYFIDISTIAAGHFTGISNVVCRMIGWFLKEHPDQVTFFLGETVIDPHIVVKIIETGIAPTTHEIASLPHGSLKQAIRASQYETTVGLFGGIKQISSVFDYEAQIIYDLTYLIAPEMHKPETVISYGSTILRDIETNDLNICISAWTRDDLVTYTHADPDKCIVSYLGHDNSTPASIEDIEPFYLMLGTIEPRKNIPLVFRAIRNRPELLDGYKLVLAGVHGWGPSLTEMATALSVDHLLDTKIVPFGYCSNTMRARLLRNARAVFYPSFYEGFGLPVVEAMAVGTPVLLSISSSLPEVGGDAAFYFDPCSVDDFLRAWTDLDRTLRDPLARTQLDERMHHQVQSFTWDNFCSTILQRIQDDLQRS